MELFEYSAAPAMKPAPVSAQEHGNGSFSVGARGYLLDPSQRHPSRVRGSAVWSESLSLLGRPGAAR